MKNNTYLLAYLPPFTHFTHSHKNLLIAARNRQHTAYQHVNGKILNGKKEKLLYAVPLQRDRANEKQNENVLEKSKIDCECVGRIFFSSSITAWDQKWFLLMWAIAHTASMKRVRVIYRIMKKKISIPFWVSIFPPRKIQVSRRSLIKASDIDAPFFIIVSFLLILCVFVLMVIFPICTNFFNDIRLMNSVFIS